MTREEAIKRLEVVRTNALIQKANGASEYWQEEIDGTIEAIDMAIESLSAPQTDLISRADAIDAVHEYFKGRMRKNKCDYDEELQVYVVGKEERAMLTYNKGINDKLRSLPSADATVGDYPNDLISRNALMEYCSNQKNKSIDNNDIARFPSADAISREGTVTLNSPISIQAEMVAVVRCKDCRHIGLFSCPLADNDFQKDEDFCSWGERREP